MLMARDSLFCLQFNERSNFSIDFLSRLRSAVTNRDLII